MTNFKRFILNHRAELGLSFIALLLRLWHLGKQSLWMDEAFSVWLASHPISDIFKVLETDSHPPLFYLLLHVVQLGGGTEAYLRFPFAVIGALNVLLIYRLGEKLVGTKAALASGFFLALSFAALYSDTQVRMYSLSVFFSMYATLSFFKVISNPSLFRWVQYFVFAVLSLLTHYFTGFILLTHLVLLIKHRKLRVALTIILGLIVVFIPWMFVFFKQILVRLTPRPSIGYREFLTLSGFLGTYDFFKNQIWNMGISLLSVAVVLWGIYRLNKAEKIKKEFLILVLLISGLLPLMISLATPFKVYLFRYAVILLPYFLMLFFYGLFQLPRMAALANFIVLVLINLCMWSFFLLGPGYERQNWREAGRTLGKHLKPRDAVVVEHFMSFFCIWYYLPSRFTLVYLPQRYAFEVRSAKNADVFWLPASHQTSSRELGQITKHFSRQWLVLCLPQFEDPSENVQKWFLEKSTPVLMTRFPSFDPEQSITVFLFHNK